MKKHPLVSIITVNYKNEEDTLAFLHSLKKAEYPAIEVILVDNAADYHNAENYKKAFPGVIYIFSSENLGFAGANNLGIERAKGKYLYFLNNDTVIEESSILPLVQAFENNPNLGAASPRIAFHSNPSLLQYAGMTPINFKTGRNNMIGNHEKDAPIYQITQEVGYAHGAAMMIPTHLIEKIGLMPTDYFLYYEELDWCEKIRKQDLEIKVIGKSRVIHKASAAVKTNSPLQTFYMTRNRLIFMHRFASKEEFRTFWMYFNWVVVPQKRLVYLLKGNKQGLAAFNQAIKAAKNHFKNQALPIEMYRTAA